MWMDKDMSRQLQQPRVKYPIANYNRYETYLGIEHDNTKYEQVRSI